MKKLLLTFLVLLFVNSFVFAAENTFATLVPSITEIMYAIDAQDKLIAVSTECNYPKDAEKKEKIGNTFYFNKERLLELSPDYLLTVEGSQFANFQITNKSKIKAVCYTMDSVNAVYDAILSVGRLTDRYDNAVKLVKKLSKDIDNTKPKRQQKILYIIQFNPIITIGNKSYLSDVIRKSGQINETDDLNEFYPAVSYEYLLTKKPDIIVVSFRNGYEKIQKLFPNTKIYFLSDGENSLINRPGPRINQAVRFFADL
ncbi:MAG: helical backbone metal receptor [Candidatus Gastranaerophilales bacterium]|nr:helical backbone metal receptor [Candidatus Gastranaerophilales bacterium]